MKYDSRYVSKCWRLGRGSADWYDPIAVGLQGLFGDEWQTVASVLAATSQRQNLLGNVTLAMKVWVAWKSGEPLPNLMEPMRQNVERALAGLPLSGPKIGPFARAVAGDVDAIVIDIWILRVYGCKVWTPKRQKWIEENIRYRAKRAGVTPRQYQAGLWFGIKALEDPVNRDERPYHVIMTEMLAS